MPQIFGPPSPYPFPGIDERPRRSRQAGGKGLDGRVASITDLQGRGESVREGLTAAQ